MEEKKPGILQPPTSCSDRDKAASVSSISGRGGSLFCVGGSGRRQVEWVSSLPSDFTSTHIGREDSRCKHETVRCKGLAGCDLFSNDNFKLCVQSTGPQSLSE